MKTFWGMPCAFQISLLVTPNLVPIPFVPGNRMKNRRNAMRRRLDNATTATHNLQPMRRSDDVIAFSVASLDTKAFADMLKEQSGWVMSTGNGGCAICPDIGTSFISANGLMVLANPTRKETANSRHACLTSLENFDFVHAPPLIPSSSSCLAGSSVLR